jgi:hypothetical protein
MERSRLNLSAPFVNPRKLLQRKWPTPCFLKWVFQEMAMLCFLLERFAEMTEPCFLK